MKIGFRLGIGFGIILLLSLIIGIVGHNRLSSMNGEVKYMMDVPIPNNNYANLWLRTVSVNAANTVAMLRSPAGVNKDYFSAQTDLDKPVLADLVKKATEAVDTAPPEEAELIKTILAQRLQYIDARNNVIKKLDGMNGDQVDDEVNKDYMPILNSYIASIKNLNDYYNKSVQVASSSISHSYEVGTIVIYTFLIVAILFGIVIAFMQTRSITKPLGKAVTIADAVAKGDLTFEHEAVVGRDETGLLLLSLKHMQDNLQKTVEQILKGAKSINTSVTEVAAGNLDLSSRTEEQASSLEETASSMEELTSTVKHNADNASQAHVLSMQAAESAKKGQSVITHVMSTMEDITASSHKMEDIINVIDGIAFQTNILALNAAVEAARAGEQGRGFAVVATEVRNLAQRSASAAKEIKALIDTSVSQIKQGRSLVTDAGTTMTEIAQGSQRSSDVIAEISASSKEQSTGIEQVSQAVMQLDQVTQQNAALVEQSAAAADSMKIQAQRLVDAVSIFTLSANDLNMTLDQTNAERKRMKDITEKPLALA